VSEQSSWADLIPSAVQFLSEGILGKTFSVLLNCNILHPETVHANAA